MRLFQATENDKCEILSELLSIVTCEYIVQHC